MKPSKVDENKLTLDELKGYFDVDGEKDFVLDLEQAREDRAKEILLKY